MPDLTHDVLDLLVCPACHSTFTWDYEASELVCTNTDCAPPIRCAAASRSCWSRKRGRWRRIARTDRRSSL